MGDSKLLWVLGHKIRSIDTDDAYGLVEITSSPKVPGPPPHYHKQASEFFFIVSGILDVMRDGQWSRMSAGAFVELPPNSVHTFINNTAQDVVWLTGWRPKGFQKFFSDFGISSVREHAREESVSSEVIARVLATCESYGMFVKQ